MSYTDVFGGSTVQPTQVQLNTIALSSSINTAWPQFATSLQPLARIMEVAATTTGLSITLPDATLTGGGQDALFNNVGANTFTVLDNSGGVVATVTSGTVWYIYLDTNTTAAGVWRVVQFGASTSSAQASQLAGNGLKAIGSVLSQAVTSATVSGSFSIQTSDRAKLYVNTGASITVTLPLSSVATTDFFFEIRNNGTGTVTIAGTGGELVDGTSTIVLQINESCHVHATSGAWYTVGRGRNQAFNFTQITKTVTGGTTTLTLSEASNVVQTYTGTLASNQTVVLPGVVQVYYFTNSTSGAYAFTVKSPVAGNTITIPTGQSAVLFCDGTNVVNASNTSSGFTTLSLAAGSAASPSLNLNGANNGVFAPTSTSVAVSAGGTEVTRWSAGQNLTVAGTASLPAYSFTAYANTGLYAPASGQVGVAAAGALVATFTSTGLNSTVIGATTPAAGSFTTVSASGGYTGITSGNVTAALGFTPYNATNPSGYISNVVTALGYTPYNATNPSGYITGITSGNVTTALGYTPYNASNPAGYITVGQQAGEICFFPATAAPTGFIKANGALVSRTTYAALYAFAVASGNMAASDGVWVEGQFSPGDGSTTFRIPDLRGNFIRGFDDSRGIDSGRTIGSLQTDAMQGHFHSLAVINGVNAGASGRTDANQSTNVTATGSPITDGTNGTPRTAAETRPRNIALLACIKY